MTKRSVVWGKQFSWTPEDVSLPSNLEELRHSILEAKSRGYKIRVIGSLHSLNELCKTSGMQIYTDKLDKILEIDKTHLTVKVEGGIKIKTLLETLAKEGLTLPNQGYIEEQSIAGAIATATHGSGKTGTFSSFVEEIDLVDANAQIHHLSRESTPHLFSAAIVSLGCLGIVYALKLKCIPLPKLHLSKVRGNLADTLKNLPQLLKENDYFQIVIDPYSDQVFTWRYKKTDAPVSRQKWYQFRRSIVKCMGILTIDYLPTPFKTLPWLLKVYMLFSSFKSCVDYSYRILSPADEGHYIEEEIAVPFERFEEALAETRKVIDTYSQQNKYMVGIILIRFVEPDQSGYLSPSLNQKTVYISLITIPKKGYENLFRDFENALYRFGGRPHWGKFNFLTKERVRELYKDQYDKFVEVRHKLDPESLFSNDWIDAIFNP
jgi:FAD/FMN-containing dehydrogenase